MYTRLCVHLCTSMWVLTEIRCVKLELWMVRSHPLWVLGTDLRFSRRAMHVSKHRVPTPPYFLRRQNEEGVVTWMVPIAIALVTFLIAMAKSSTETAYG